MPPRMFGTDWDRMRRCYCWHCWSEVAVADDEKEEDDRTMMLIVGEAESSKIAGAVSDTDHAGPSRADGNRRSPSERPCIREDET